MTYAEPAGSTIIVHFDHVGGGLVARGGPLTHFELAGADGIFHSADAAIEGRTVEVRSSMVPRPVAVRYAWRDTAQPNLFNLEGLPASGFQIRVPS